MEANFDLKLLGDIAEALFARKFACHPTNSRLRSGPG